MAEIVYHKIIKGNNILGNAEFMKEEREEEDPFEYYIEVQNGICRRKEIITLIQTLEEMLEA